MISHSSNSFPTLRFQFRFIWCLMLFLRSFLLMGTWLIDSLTFCIFKTFFFWSNRWMISWLGIGSQVQSRFNSIEQKWFFHYCLLVNFLCEDPDNKDFGLCKLVFPSTTHLCNCCTDADIDNMKTNRYTNQPLQTPLASKGKEGVSFFCWVINPD